MTTPTRNCQTLADQLRATRIHKGLTIKQIATQTRQRPEDIENTERAHEADPFLSTFVAYAHALHLQVVLQPQTDDTTPEPDEPSAVIDADGDQWHLSTDGEYRTHHGLTDQSLTLNTLRSTYGPLTMPDGSPL